MPRNARAARISSGFLVMENTHCAQRKVLIGSSRNADGFARNYQSEAMTRKRFQSIHVGRWRYFLLTPGISDAAISFFLRPITRTCA
jgi:hypothetical protein